SSRLKSVQPQLELSRDYLSTRTLAITYQTNTIGYYGTGSLSKFSTKESLILFWHKLKDFAVAGFSYLWPTLIFLATLEIAVRGTYFVRVVLENNNRHLTQLSAEGPPLFRALLASLRE